MYTGFKHTHTLVIVLFILLFFYKSFLLLTDRKEQLKAFREKWKIADMILGTLILVTGVYLYFNYAFSGAFQIIKLIIALASIPLGIIAFKKEIKPIAIALSVVFIYLFLVSFTKSYTIVGARMDSVANTKTEAVKDTLKPENSILDQNANAVADLGKQIYAQNCVVCHGDDGKLGLSGAKDLTVSTVSHADKAALVKDGKGSMPPFKQFSEQDVEAVVTYVESLKK